ncbi:hypothetical protein DH2020_027752 [Rehmannia glutinosa]|uniref:Ubiquinone biosynthesis monooxygenase COQ6, mitochondrial n=1 Tax=Rehmannia glutinosa TaxID=99300 RepID=A0ABR0VUB6_REHGL
MNRITARRVTFNINALKSAQRTLCGGAGVKLPGADSDQEIADKHGFHGNLPVHDVAIVGGGMVGMALACSLAHKPLTNQLNVAIIDSNPALLSGGCIKKEDPPDPRVSTVTPATMALFKEMGAWKYVEQHRHAYFDKMQVIILGTILSSMTMQPSSSSSPHGSLAKLELSDGNSLYAKLVVGSDGSKSRVKELAGINSTGWKYSQNAIICTVQHTDENRCAWQRFLPNGPIALLPIGDNFSNIVWTMNPDESSDRKSMSEVDFVKEVNSALDNGYGPHPKSQLSGGAAAFSWLTADTTLSANECFEVPPKVTKLASERMVFPLSLNHANSYALKRVALIGDAAHTVHPLAGQGVNMGFGDAFSLSKVIAEGIAVGSDIGEVTLLRRYESERKPANLTMMAILDGFQKAYSVDFGPLNVLRAAAFQGAHYISPLKRNIISYASGEQRFPLFS